jgi:hypothetical protein
MVRKKISLKNILPILYKGLSSSAPDRYPASQLLDAQITSPTGLGTWFVDRSLCTPAISVTSVIPTRAAAPALEKPNPG